MVSILKVLMACTSGMSSTLVEESIKKYVLENKIDLQIDSLSSEDAKGVASKYDVVLLAPQAAYMAPAFRKAIGNIPLGIIAGADYAMANAKAIVELVKKIQAEAKK